MQATTTLDADAMDRWMDGSCVFTFLRGSDTHAHTRICVTFT